MHIQGFNRRRPELGDRRPPCDGDRSFGAFGDRSSEVLQRLLMARADVERRTREGLTATFIAAQELQPQPSAVMWACSLACLLLVG